MFSSRLHAARALLFTITACAAASLGGARAGAEALLLVEVESGKVLHAENATVPWYPASVTKIMTTYVTLRAVKEGRITLDKPVAVSPAAASQAPTKMGFPVGTIVTIDNAIKMLMVKSANDMAVVLAEGVAGSIENFAEQMNQTAKRLGMTQSHFVNPNGLPADEQIVSARDLAILARTAIKEFPEYDYYWHLPGIRFGKRVYRNYNTLIGRYPGADGMKTGFICASGFNLVATATRDGKRVIAVVLGASSGAARAMKAAQLLERGFVSSPLAWLTPSLGTVESLQPVNTDPPNLREDMCGGHRKRPASEDEEDPALANVASSSYAVFLSALRPATSKSAALLQDAKLGEPVVVFTGPAKKLGAPVAPAPATQVATVDPKAAKPVARAAAVAGRPAAAAAVPWTTLCPSGSVNPPPDISSVIEHANANDGVPLPRARPRFAIQTSQAPPPPKPAAAPAPATATAPKAAPKAAPKPSPNGQNTQKQ
jgi:D-alanyl-D-alanine carboxypeptidase